MQRWEYAFAPDGALAMPHNKRFVAAGEITQGHLVAGDKSVFISGGIVSRSGAIAFKFTTRTDPEAKSFMDLHGCRVLKPSSAKQDTVIARPVAVGTRVFSVRAQEFDDETVTLFFDNAFTANPVCHFEVRRADRMSKVMGQLRERLVQDDVCSSQAAIGIDQIYTSNTMVKTLLKDMGMPPTKRQRL